MAILNQPASRICGRTEDANRKAAVRCIAYPALLAEVAEGFTAEDVAIGRDV
jgi:hypothetical protein